MDARTAIEHMERISDAARMYETGEIQSSEAIEVWIDFLHLVANELPKTEVPDGHM